VGLWQGVAARERPDAVEVFEQAASQFSAELVVTNQLADVGPVSLLDPEVVVPLQRPRPRHGDPVLAAVVQQRPVDNAGVVVPINFPHADRQAAADASRAERALFLGAVNGGAHLPTGCRRRRPWTRSRANSLRWAGSMSDEKSSWKLPTWQRPHSSATLSRTCSNSSRRIELLRWCGKRTFGRSVLAGRPS
jgi:hypothetical protein